MPSKKGQYVTNRQGYVYPLRKNVPIPEPNKSPGSGQKRGKCPWAKMEIGDCFFAPDRDSANMNRAVQTQYRLHPDDGRLYTIRTTPRGVGCWRVK